MSIKATVHVVAVIGAISVMMPLQARQIPPAYQAGQTAKAIQNPDPSQSQPADEGEAESMVATGELLRVDTSAKMIEVRTGPNTVKVFQYTDDTEVKGADRAPRGFATMAGSKITVRYAHHGETDVATEIEVHDQDK
jgi:hypothetical protein